MEINITKQCLSLERTWPSMNEGSETFRSKSLLILNPCIRVRVYIALPYTFAMISRMLPNLGFHYVQTSVWDIPQMDAVVWLLCQLSKHRENAALSRRKQWCWRHFTPLWSCFSSPKLVRTDFSLPKSRTFDTHFCWVGFSWHINERNGSVPGGYI